MESNALEPEYDHMIPRALKALRERPVYLAYAPCFCFLSRFIFMLVFLI
jgi:hypothetical protein